MSISPEIRSLIIRLEQEMHEMELDAKEGLNIIQPIISSFPNNFLLTQFFASLSNNLFYVEILSRRIQIIENRLLLGDATADEILEIGEDLGIELGRSIEAKISIKQIVERLRKLP